MKMGQVKLVMFLMTLAVTKAVHGSNCDWFDGDQGGHLFCRLDGSSVQILDRHKVGDWLAHEISQEK